MGKKVTLLDYGAGNVRSVRNAFTSLGYEVVDVATADDILSAERIVFPGVGSIGSCMETLKAKGFVEPLIEYLRQDRPFLGICLGLQCLFERSEEGGGAQCLGVVPGSVDRFNEPGVSVPHIGWNEVDVQKETNVSSAVKEGDRVYFVHSFRAQKSEANQDWVLCETDYGSTRFISAIQKGNVCAVQFHPEKSGQVGLNLLKGFVEGEASAVERPQRKVTTLAKRIIACLDVRSNDQGDLVVTKGDQYDVRDETAGDVRNLGKPVELAKRYSSEGADEVTFLNITAFRELPLSDMPMLHVLENTSKEVFVPLTVGGGIREYTDQDGKSYPAVEVAAAYFRAGADKVSIGSDAVFVAEEYRKNGFVAKGDTAIEQISRVYGSQAVVISVDPKRVYLKDGETTTHTELTPLVPGPNGESRCWYQCTVKGGRETRDIDPFELAEACEKLGAGEILLNCIDQDGTNSGFDIPLVTEMKRRVTIPVIASSGAGNAQHFERVFQQTQTEAALAAGIFHRREVPIEAVKDHLQSVKIPVRK